MAVAIETWLQLGAASNLGFWRRVAIATLYRNGEIFLFFTFDCGKFPHHNLSGCVLGCNLRLGCFLAVVWLWLVGFDFICFWAEGLAFWV
jgi:hypothetical protein